MNTSPGNSNFLAQAPYARLSNEAKLARDAYNKFGGEYIKRYREDVSKMREYLQIFLESLPPNSAVLDIGCGFGNYVRYYLDQDLDAYGIDISETMLREARRMLPNNRVFAMDMHHLTFHNESFNGVSAVTSLLYTNKLQLREILVQVNRILKGKGKLFLVMLEGASEGVEKEEHGSIACNTYTAYYTAQELQSILEETGFAVEHSVVKRVLLDEGREIFLWAEKSSRPTFTHEQDRRPK